MSEHRPFHPSPRRLSLARASGLTAASPVLVGALACGAAVLAAVMLAGEASSRLAGWLTDACAGSPASSPLARVPGAILDLALPLLGAVAIVAIVAHVAQTRALWLPRRRIPGAPAVPVHRTARGVFELGSAIIVGFVAFGWLWLTAPRLADLFSLDSRSLPAAAGAALASFLVAIVVAWLALAVIDALARHAALLGALAMTPTEKREDDRLAAADPRWRAQRALFARGHSVADAVAGAAVVLLGDDVAIAVAWDPVRQPIPSRAAIGRRARATQLVGLARRHRIAVHRDAMLAAVLADGEGPVPELHWARLAEIIAAVRAR